MASKAPKRRATVKMKKIKKRVIVFSSRESLDLANAIQANLHIDTYSTKVWTDGFFKLSQSYISNFQNIQYDYDFAFVICGADDVLTSRGRRKKTSRDNVFLELGMCISSFSLKRVVIIKHKDVTLPSDLSGIHSIEYTLSEDEDIDAVAGTICSRAIQHMNRSDLSKRQYIKLSWDEYFLCMKKLTEKLSLSIPLGGYEFDAIIGINRGGLMAADLIARENSQNVPVLPIFADRRSGNSRFDSKDFLISNADLLNCLASPNICNILLIDSFTRDGISVIEAKKFLETLFPDKTIKSAVIYANKRLKDDSPDVLKSIDYIGDFKYLDGKKLSLD